MRETGAFWLTWVAACALGGAMVGLSVSYAGVLWQICFGFVGLQCVGALLGVPQFLVLRAWGLVESRLWILITTGGATVGALVAFITLFAILLLGVQPPVAPLRPWLLRLW